MEDPELPSQDQKESTDASQDPALPPLAPPPLLLRLPEEVIFIIGQHLLLKDGLDQKDIRSLRCTSKRLASTLRPLAWGSHLFALDTNSVKESTKLLVRNERLQSYVRYAEWQLPATIPFSVFPRLSNLRVLSIVMPPTGPKVAATGRRATRSSSTSLPFAVTETLRSIRYLRTLSIGGASGFADENFNLAEHLPFLIQLELADWRTSLPGGQNVRALLTKSLAPYLSLLDTVETLRLGALSSSDVEALELALLETDDTCALQHLRLPQLCIDAPCITDALRVFASCGNLHSLTLNLEVSAASDLTALDSIQLPSVLRLRLHGWDYGECMWAQRDKGSFAVVQKILKVVPNLDTLVIEGDWTARVPAFHLLTFDRSAAQNHTQVMGLVEKLARETEITTLYFVDVRDSYRTQTAITFNSERRAHIW